MGDPDDTRQRLRDKIRHKRDVRCGTTETAESSDNTTDNPFPRINDPATRAELSRRVEEEMRRIFGSDPETMRIAQRFIDDPISVLKPNNMDTDEQHLSEGEKTAIESRMKISQEEDDEEAPPMQ
tara:strand:+ start:38804 stop:39178 length:375 start_codon:yes stop_codon:yes gene_type:complete